MPLQSHIQASPSVGSTLGSRLTWLDILIIVTISFSAFALGDAVSSFISGQPVESLAAFEARNGVLAARNTVAIAQARQAKLQERIATDYLAATLPNSAAADQPSSPSNSRPLILTIENIMRLEYASATLVAEQERAQISLAGAERAAQEARSDALNHRAWRDRIVRVVVSFIILALICFIVIMVSSLSSSLLPIAVWPVITGGIMLFAVMIIAQAITWVVALAFAVILVVLLVRGGANEQ